MSEQLDFYFARVETGQPNILNTHPVIFQANRVNTEKAAAGSYRGVTEWARNLSPVPWAPRQTVCRVHQVPADRVLAAAKPSLAVSAEQIRLICVKMVPPSLEHT